MDCIVKNKHKKSFFISIRNVTSLLLAFGNGRPYNYSLKIVMHKQHKLKNLQLKSHLIYQYMNNL